MFINSELQYEYEEENVAKEEYPDYEGIAELEGEDAKKFLEDDAKDMTEEEEHSLAKAEETYKKYCKSQ